MAITFAVDDVTALRTPLPTIALADALHEMTGVAIFQPSHEAALVALGRDAHPLVQAVHLAFSEHRPLFLPGEIIDARRAIRAALADCGEDARR